MVPLTTTVVSIAMKSDHSEEFLYTGSCSPWLDTIGDCTMNSVGWVGSVRDVDCTGKFIDDNDDCNGVSCFTAFGQTVCLDCDDGQARWF